MNNRLVNFRVKQLFENPHCFSGGYWIGLDAVPSTGSRLVGKHEVKASSKYAVRVVITSSAIV